MDPPGVIMADYMYIISIYGELGGGFNPIETYMLVKSNAHGPYKVGPYQL